MEPKREGNSSGAAPRTPTKKPKSASRVKVVASRYAQALQSKNIESRARAGSTVATTASAATGRQRAPGVSGSSVGTSVATAAGTRPSATVTPSAHALAKRAVHAAAAAHPLASASVTTTPRGGVAAPSDTASPAKQDLKERLKAYKASKALLAHAPPASALATTPSPRAVAPCAKPRAVAKPHAARDRPGFPKRIGVTERSTKRPAKVASDPIPAETTIITAARPLSAGSTPRARTTAAHVPSSAVTAALAPAAHTHDDDERELLEGLYYQLCFTEMRAAAAFRQQEQTAERQLLAAWHVLESKLQLLHDTALRLDREQHVRALEANLNDQTAVSTQLASHLPAFIDDLGAVCRALEASLLRLPTRGVRCSDPRELARRVAALTVELTALLQRVHASQLDTQVSDAVTFERAMAQTADATSASLLQVAHAVDALVREVTTETSLRIEQIQCERLAAMTLAIASANDNDDDASASWW